MADANAQIKVNIDTSNALSSLKLLQAQISAFQTSMARSGAEAARAASNIQRNLVENINATGQFSAQIKTIASETEAFTTALEKNKMSLGQYFRYAGGASKDFGRFFKREFDTIQKVAVERVKDLQTQYIQLGRDANGAMKSIAVRPLALDMENLSTKTQIAAQKQQLLNQLLKQGSTNLLNFGKNTQWAGRQLMVGFTIPLTMLGTTAAKTFMEMEEQVIKFKRVYGDLGTTIQETDAMAKNIRNLANEFTKYGVAAKDTMALAASAAASGKMGADLIAQTTEATRLSVLGQIDQQQALETTISLTNAFSISADQLAKKINFLNATENQTVTSIEDLSIAIPKAAPVIQQLGGDVEDLTFFLTAMKEGGINASEGANALKSGLAAMINPTGKAAEMLKGFGINLKGMVEANKGDVKGLVIDFANALDKLDPLNRARAIEQLFGKFQFSRLSTLFQNVIAEGSQANKVLNLASTSSIQLASMASKELSRVSESPMYKFKKAIEDIKTSLMPVGEEFLKMVTPIISFGADVLNQFNKLDDGVKKFVIGFTAVAAGLGPLFLMTFGLIANGVANVIKGFSTLKGWFNKTGSSSMILGEQVDYMTQQQLESAAVAASLEQVHTNLTQAFNVEAGALGNLRMAYERATAAQLGFTQNNIVPRPASKKFASGGMVHGPGSGTSDSIPAMVSNGEFIVSAKRTKQYLPLLQNIAAGKVPGFASTETGGSLVGQLVKGFKNATMYLPESWNTIMGRRTSQGVPTKDVTSYMRSASDAGMAPLMAAMASSMKMSINDPKIRSEWEQLGKAFANAGADALDKAGIDFVKDEHLEEILVPALRDAAKNINIAGENVGVALDKTLTEIRTAGAVGTQSGASGALGRVNLGGSYKGVGGQAQRYAIESGNRMFGKNTVPSKSKGFKRLFQTFNPVSQQWETATMAHITSSITTTVEKLKAQVSSYLGDVGEKIVKAASGGVVDGVKKSTRQASPSKEAYDAGENIGKGAIDGIRENTDEARIAGENIADSVINGATRRGRRVSVPGTNMGSQASNIANAKNRRRRATQPAGSFDENGNFVPIFIPTPGEKPKPGQKPAPGMSPVPYGPNLPTRKEKFKQKYQNIKTGVTKVSGFKVSAGLGTGAMVAGMAGMAGIPGMDTISMVLGGLSMFGGVIAKIIPHLLKFAGPIGIAVTAIGGLIAITNATNEAKKKELEQINAVANAAKTTASELETVARLTGSTVTKSPIESIKAGTAAGESGTSKGSQFNKDVASLIESQTKDEDFNRVVTGLKSASVVQGRNLLRAKYQELVGSGIDANSAAAQIAAYQQASGRRFGFTQTNLAGKAGAKGFETSFASNLKTYATSASKTKTVSYGTVTGKFMAGREVEALNKQGITGVKVKEIAPNQFRIYRKVSSDQDKAAMQESLQNTANFIKGVSGQFASGQLSVVAFNKRIKVISSSFKNLEKTDPAAALSQFRGVIKLINPDLAKVTNGITNTSEQMLIMKAAMAGVAEVASLSAIINDAALNPQNEEKRIAAEKARIELRKLTNAQLKITNDLLKDEEDTPGGNSDGIDKITAALEKQKAALEAKLKSLQNITDELSKQQQFELAQMQRMQDMKQAMLSGNYMKASILKQENAYSLAQFNREKQITSIKSQIDNIQAKIDARAQNKASGGLLKGPGTGTSDSIRGMMNYALGGQIPINLSNGEFVTRASSVAKYGVGLMNSINQGTYNPGSSSSVYNVSMTINGGNADAKEIADMVMKRFDTIQAKNNTSNKVRF